MHDDIENSSIVNGLQGVDYQDDFYLLFKWEVQIWPNTGNQGVSAEKKFGSFTCLAD